MNKNESGWVRFCAWVNGEREEVESRLFSISQAPEPQKRVERHGPKKEEGQRLKGFLGWYPLASVAVGVCIVCILMAAVLALPPFGEEDNPTNNEVPAYYLRHTVEDTGASNAVAGLILNYRGFDTFGESCVLFLAVSCVFMLLQREGSAVSSKERLETARGDAGENGKWDIILQEVARLLVPMVFLFGFFMLLGGHHSPGGGFSGGAVLGGGLVLYESAFGHRAMGRFFNERIYDVARVSGLLLYAGLFGYYIFTGANGLENHISMAAGGLILPIDIAVGLVVACTMYGFYAMFNRGAL